MSILKATKDSENVTLVQPDSETAQAVADLKARGYKNIHDAETGEKYPLADEITTKDQAIQYAMDWQNKVAEENLSYAELAEQQTELRALAERFDLVEEFEENGII